MTNSLLKLMINTSDIIKKKTPLLDEKELLNFVQSFVERKDQFIKCYEKYGSPLYAFDRAAVIKQLSKFRTAFETNFSDIRIYYAMKSNNHPMMVKTIVENGVGIDISSGKELNSALEAGASDIIFSGPGKQDEELELALKNNKIVTVLIDSFGELERLDKIASKLNKGIKAGVRLTTVESGIWRKFGIPLDKLPQFFKQADNCLNVQLTGLQFHLSWNMNPEKQIAFISQLGFVLRNLDYDHRRKIKFIDIGGGFWPEQGEWLQKAATQEGMIQVALDKIDVNHLEHFKNSSVPIEDFASGLSSAVKKYIPDSSHITICVEPGRWLSNEAMHILLKVIDVKNHNLVITDGGTNAIGWDRFEQDYFPVINLSRPSLIEKECLVAGSLCTPHDIWGYSYFGESINEGDLLIVPNQGAYTYSLRQDFIKEIPGTVLLEY